MPRGPSAVGQLDHVVARLVLGTVRQRLLDALAARDDRPRSGRQDRPAEDRRTDVEHLSPRIAAGDDLDRTDGVEVGRPSPPPIRGRTGFPRATLDARGPCCERGVGVHGDRGDLAVAADDLESQLAAR